MILRNICLFLIIPILISSCNENDEAPVAGEFIIDGKQYELHRGYVMYDDRADEIVVFFISRGLNLNGTSAEEMGKGNIAAFSLGYFDSQLRPLSGTYSYSDLSDPPPSSFGPASIAVDYDLYNLEGYLVDVKDGSIGIKISQKSYEFEWNWILDDNKTVTGTFNGPLEDHLPL